MQLCILVYQARHRYDSAFYDSKNFGYTLLWDFKKVLSCRREEPLILQVLFSAATEKEVTVVQMMTETTGNKAKFNKFYIFKYASREPYIFLRKISNYCNYFCLLFSGNFIL